VELARNRAYLVGNGLVIETIDKMNNKPEKRDADLANVRN
jgi:hypothetical protein